MHINPSTEKEEIEVVNAVAFSDQVPVGFNPEMADMGNPHGVIYKVFWFVSAITKDGTRYHHQKSWKNSRDVLDSSAQMEATRLANRVIEAGIINLEYWVSADPVYGSKAWEREDAFRQLAHESGPLAGTVRDY